MVIWTAGIEPVMMVLLLLAGLTMALRLGFLPLRRPGVLLRSWRDDLRGTNRSATLRTAACALAGTVGTGNMVGVAAALTAGGPGAVFWMWISALAGMVLKYSEILLTLLCRQEDGRGGPMTVLRHALGLRWLPDVFAAAGAAAAFGIGSMTQVHSAARAAETAWGMPGWIMGVALALLALPAVRGGGARIARACALLTPVMTGLYLALAGSALWVCRSGILPALGSIFREAFRPAAAVGGLAGASLARTVTVGLSRGIFTHEAGMGSAAIIHADAPADDPVRHSLWGVFEVFADTWVVCTVTALVILAAPASCGEGAAVTLAAFSAALGDWAGAAAAGCLALFALAALLGWYLCGSRCLAWLTSSPVLRRVYGLAYILCAAAAPHLSMAGVWAAADVLNVLMILPNVIGMLALSGTVARITRAYFAKVRPARETNLPILRL